MRRWLILAFVAVCMLAPGSLALAQSPSPSAAGVGIGAPSALPSELNVVGAGDPCALLTAADVAAVEVGVPLVEHDPSQQGPSIPITDSATDICGFRPDLDRAGEDTNDVCAVYADGSSRRSRCLALRAAGGLWAVSADLLVRDEPWHVDWRMWGYDLPRGVEGLDTAPPGSQTWMFELGTPGNISALGVAMSFPCGGRSCLLMMGVNANPPSGDSARRMFDDAAFLRRVIAARAGS